MRIEIKRIGYWKFTSSILAYKVPQKVYLPKYIGSKLK